MKNILTLISAVVIAVSSLAQSAGDTIIVKSLFYGSSTRDTTVNFPVDQNLSFSKILLKYNMRCKDGLVSNGSNRNRGCGEWDYSCNTYIHDPSKIDSLKSKQPSHVISDFSGSSFDYSSNPLYNYYLNYQSNVNIDSIISETQSTVGTGVLSLKNVIQTVNKNGKSQYVYTASELTQAGLSTGTIDGLMINVLNASGTADFLRVRIKAITDSSLNGVDPALSGFTEVYFKNTNLSVGLNRLQFSTLYNWNGSDNLLIEFSFSNPSSTSSFEIEGHNLLQNRALTSSGDNYLIFNGINYIEAANYKGIGGNSPRTIEAWIKTTEGGQEIVSWGQDAGGEKWNLRLEGTGELRVEVNGGNKIGVTDLRDNNWHHIACTFSGTNVTQVKLYVDGVLEGNGSQASKAINTDNVNGINVRVSRGTNNRYFNGLIDEVRIWDTLLTDVELHSWMHKNIDTNHPKFNQLAMHYSLNEGSGSVVIDSSANNRNATVIQGGNRHWIKGIDLFKEFSVGNERPNITFLQGNYQTTTIIDTIIDSVIVPQHAVTSYQVFANPGTIKSDSLAATLGYYWQAGYSYVFDTTGLVVDSILASTHGTFNITTLDFFKRYPMRFEIISFVTPYGIGLDLSPEGKTWTTDLTDFSPILRGDKRLTMEWGGQWQEDMDIQFLFIVGTPPRDVLDIEQIWRVTKPSYTNISNDVEFEKRIISLNPLGKSFKINSAITGHGQEGEFISRTHFIDIDNSSFRETWQVWKACGSNPVHPQGGTWIYDRAGWCPGMATDIREIDISSKVTAGSDIEIDYGVVTASGATNYIVNNQLVTYGNPNFILDATVIDIKSPTSAIEYAKTNYTCANPTIQIQNTGSTALTSLDISYWINDSPTKESFTWAGNLEFLESEEVILPAYETDLWKAMKANGNKFYVEVDSPNEGSDEYAYNNTMSSDFEIPAVLPREFVIWFKANNAANESKLYVYDEYGTEVFSRTSFQNNTEYRDTMRLDHGCYSIILKDTDGDGINFWANNDGAGFLRLTTLDSPFGSTIMNLEPDFGDFIQVNFTTEFPLSFEEIELIKNDGFEIYPNPATDQVIVEFKSDNNQEVIFRNMSGQVVAVNYDKHPTKRVFNTRELTKGIYLVSIINNGKIESKKVMVQ